MDSFGISDLSRSHNLRAANLDLNRALVQLSEEVVTGRASDTTLRVNAQFSFLTQIESDLVTTQARADALSDAAITAQTQQSALDRIVATGDDLFETLVLARNDAGALGVSSMAELARGYLDTIIGALNTNLGGRYVFSGTNVTTPPIAATDQLLADLASEVSGATDEADLRALTDQFFNAPTGGFQAKLYQGAADGLSPVDLGNGETVTLSLKANDPAFRAMLQSVALIAVMDEPALAFSDAEKRAMIIGETDQVLNAQSRVIELRATLGFSEERIDRTTTRLEVERSSLELARSDLLNVDPFETATALEAVRQQLETLYSVTARTQNLSLVNFL